MTIGQFFLIGNLLAALALGMLIPALLAAVQQHEDWQVFVTGALVTGFIAGALILTNRGTLPPLNTKQAFLLTSLSWLALTGFAALPFAFSALNLSYTDAFFEAMSGLTTTGATIITDLDAASPGILLWRALLQWFGGIGIIVMAISVLPMLNVGGMQLFRLESSDTSEKILPRTAQIAGAIAQLYFAVTALCALAYLVAGMGVFDALAHAMTTIATGGFSTRNDSLAAFDSAAIETVGVVFMLAASLPFVAYLQVINGKRNALWQDEQVRVFLTLVVFISLTLWLYQIGIGMGDSSTAFLKSLFNTTSILTGTGYATADYDNWGAACAQPVFCHDFYRRLRWLHLMRHEDFPPASDCQSRLVLH